MRCHSGRPGLPGCSLQIVVCDQHLLDRVAEGGMAPLARLEAEICLATLPDAALDRTAGQWRRNLIFRLQTLPLGTT